MNAQQTTIEEKLELIKKHEPYWSPHRIERNQFQRELEKQFFREARFQGYFGIYGIVEAHCREEKNYYPPRKNNPFYDRSKHTTTLFFKLDKKGFHISYYREVARNAREVLTIAEFILQLEKDVQKTMYTFKVGPRQFDLHYCQEIVVLLETTIRQETDFANSARTLSTIDTKITEYLEKRKKEG